MTSTNTLIFGGSDLIGSACVRYYEKSGYFCQAPSRNECDGSDDKAVRECLDNLRPQAVILAVGAVGGISQNLRTPADFLFQNTKS